MPLISPTLDSPVGRSSVGRPLGLVALLVGGAAVLAAAGAAGLAGLAYPALVFAGGAVLYRHRPVGYIAYAWGVLFFTPLVRRVVDFGLGGYSSISLVMLAPYLVAGLSAVSLLRCRRALGDRVFKPFALALAGVAWGYAVGVVQNGLRAATFDALEWAAPVLFGLHTALVWREYPALREALGRAFTLGVLGVGVYGLVQFFVLPEWDRLWMLGSGLYDASGPYVVTYIGHPEPFGVRVFSTLNAPGPNAMVVTSGLLLFFGLRGAGRVAAAVPGYVTLLLSLVRSAWGGWVVGVGYLVLQASREVRLRAAVAVTALGAAAAAVVASVPAVRDVVVSRLLSVVELGGDTSLQSRSEFLSEIALDVATHPLGHGLGSTGTAAKLSAGATFAFDNGLVNVPYVLGWPGGTLFFLGVALFVGRALRSSGGDAFSTAAEAAALGVLAQIVFVNTLVSTVGFVFWCFMGVSSAQALWSEHGPDAPAHPPARSTHA